MAAKALHPPLKWSQKKHEVVINIELRDITDEKIDFSNGTHLHIQVTSSGKQYTDSFELFEPIDAQKSTLKKTGFHAEIKLVKKGDNKWTRITKENIKSQTITVDWNNYVDSDDEKQEVDMEENRGFDFGGADGGEGPEGGDSDDEEPKNKLDDLEGEADVQQATKPEA